MKKWLDKKFPKKFKVKLVHYVSGYYAIEYAHYRFIENWSLVCDWSPIMGWTRKLERHHYQSEFHCLDDVIKYHKRQDEKRKAHGEQKRRELRLRMEHSGKILVNK